MLFIRLSGIEKKVILEIVSFWTPEYLNKKIEKIKQANRKDMLIAVDQQLKCSREDFQGKVLFYKNRINVDEVIEILLNFKIRRKN